MAWIDRRPDALPERNDGMPDYLKPLFHRRLLADALRELPPAPDDAQRAIALSWAAGAANGSLLGRKEEPLQGQFLSEVMDAVVVNDLYLGRCVHCAS
jgi:hypothetical protein